ncbi:BTAD domain-containing putative transcriptional regulator [Streptomyces sp. NBC_00989]|uniref:AfsR/SARP family transcriptional regulator n=1 Tax=Streptomyces sp. NBC_00989 TaxID=2903705 RepID=UPI003863F09E|nr:AfsR/SARP family transcriptional regulator [Streptomyces sp. NBC_00989]WSW97997.1 AfsR/SARP family transcriptional regulator [Streptomyces sp. NBC_00989]
MDIEVLGALAVRVNGVSVVPTAPKPRRVLGLLALHADQVVAVGALVEELWGALPPRSARTTLQTYVLQLRELIGVALAAPEPQQRQERGEQQEGGGGGRLGAKDVLATVPGGYRLSTRGGTVDHREFERRAGTGYRAMDAEDYAGAARRLAGALDLWSGPALTGLQAGSQIGMEARRLEEARLCALAQRIDADLRLGRHRELLPELTVLVSRHRMHESLHGQFMVALHRAGRRGEALDVYQRLRTTLVTELGLEPSAPLGRLQRSILTARPDSAPVTAPAAGGTTPQLTARPA